MKKRRDFQKRYTTGARSPDRTENFNRGGVQDIYVNLSTSVGRCYGSWITGTRASAITDANVVSGGAIYNPVGVIESIAQDEIITRHGLSTLGINTDSFDTAYDERSSWTFALSINNQITAMELISQLAYQSGCKVFFNHENKLSIKAYNTANSVDMTFAEDPTGLQESINTGHIFGSPVVQPRYLADMSSSVQINYAYDYGKNLFRQNVYVNSAGSNWTTVSDTDYIAYCDDAETLLGNSGKKYIIDAMAIQDKTTAEYLCAYIADRAVRRLYYATFTTGIEGIQLEIGDFVNIQHRLTSTLFPSTYLTKKWEVVGIKFLGNEMAYEISTIEV